MTDAMPVPEINAPGDQAEGVRRLTAGLIQMRDTIRDLGPVPPGPDRNRLFVAINGFSAAVMETLFRPKTSLRPSRSRSSVTKGWIGG